MTADIRTYGRRARRWTLAVIGAALPSTGRGPFNVTLRDYWPKEAMLDGTYKLPPMKKVQ